MGRVASWGAALAAALGFAACGGARDVAAPAAAQSSCASCHTAPGEGPPFRDQTGSTDPQRLTVGAHDAHLHGFLGTVACGECHIVPQKVGDPGHLDDPTHHVHFGPVARTGGADPRYEQQGCAATYCHGNFPGGNRGNRPAWLAGPNAAQCGSCHAIPPPSGRHPEHQAEGIRCDQCHGPFLTATHVNGKADVTLPAFDARLKTCAQACHTPRSWPGEGDAGL